MDNELALMLDRLSEISKSVTKEDRQYAMRQLRISAKSTISLYLNNKGTNLDTAIRLFNILNTRIKNRQKKIATL
jgi:hypothetical protein